jgi:photosystem II stability/assembly factor-like uncharacterized protein
MIKTLCHILTFVFLPLQLLYPQWQWQNPLPQGNTISSIMHLNENTIWASVWGGGSLLKSVDGGANWEVVILPERIYSEDIFFINENVGWTCGQVSNSGPETRNLVLGTKDGGKNWQVQLEVPSFNLFTIAFANENEGWVSGDAARIYHTTDGGNNWELQANLSGDVLSLELVNSLHIWAARGSGIGEPLIYTANGGRNWIADSSITWAYDTSFLDTLNGWVCGRDKIARTTDGGNNWEIQLNIFPLEWTDIVMISRNYGYAITSFETQIAITTNGGINWSFHNNPAEYDLRCISFKDSLNGIAAGQWGTMIKTYNGGIDWNLITQRISSSWLFDIYFINGLQGWIAGWDGTILRTINSGSSWIALTTNTTQDLQSIIFINNNEGFAVGESNTIIRTTNSGDSWIAISNPVMSNWNSIDFKNYPTGWITGGDALTTCKLIKSTNGGLNWNEITGISFPAGTPRIQFTSVEVGWIMIGNTTTGGQQRLFKTTNAGVDWDLVLSNNSDTAYLSMHFISDEIGWISTFPSFTLFRTTDSGRNWQSFSTPLHFNSLFFINSDTGWAGSSNGDINYTTDGGENWQSQLCPGTGPVRDIFFIDQYNGWMSGSIGRILHTTNGGVTFVEDYHEIKLPAEQFVLFQNYPNPFNPTTKIKFTIPSVETTRRVVSTTLKVYDVLGNEVATLVNEEKQVGTYTVLFNAGNLSSGIYFCQLKTKDFVGTKKMILLK